MQTVSAVITNVAVNPKFILQPPTRNPLGFGLTALRPMHSFRRLLTDSISGKQSESGMKVRNSLRSLKSRDKNCRIIRRKGRVYVINKKNPRFKARQG